MQLGIIKNFTINIDYKKIGKPILAYIFIVGNYSKTREMKRIDVKKEIERYVKSEEIYLITGDFDIVCKMHFSDMEQLSKTIEVLRTKVGYIDKTYTMFALPFGEKNINKK